MWSFLQVVLEQVKFQHPHVTNDKGTLFHGRLRRSIREQIQLLQSLSSFCWFSSGSRVELHMAKVHVTELEALWSDQQLKPAWKDQLTTRFWHHCTCSATVSLMSLGSSFFYMSSTTIRENVILLQDRYNAAQTVKGTRQLHRFVPQPLGKLLVYNTSLQASPPTEWITPKIISLYRVQIEDNTLQIGSFVACTYDEKWWLGMVAQVSDEFGDHNINSMHLSGPGKQFHLPTKVDTCWSLKPQFCLLHHYGNTSLVRMTIKNNWSTCMTNSLYNGTSWNILYIQFRQFNIYS